MNLNTLPTRLLKVVTFAAACLLPVAAAAQAMTDETFTGKVVRVDQNDNTITVETPEGLSVYDVDNENLEITEVGIFENTHDPEMRELRLGDLVRITETVPTAVPERQRVVRMERKRPPVQIAQAEPEPRPVVQPQPRMLPKTASPLPLVALSGAVLMGLAGVVRLVRRA